METLKSENLTSTELTSIIALLKLGSPVEKTEGQLISKSFKTAALYNGRTFGISIDSIWKLFLDELANNQFQLELA